ncbi:hypothetical protein AMS68_002470 [Peltaster fructicola]|uniref:Major facilitator superfamily (MFS) profile domain-containing protein n=1 Tax=Peltaster fructicola TaxID=286661 RepID=A0A6H0XQG9_9PEZI|nr:hypothetical protein AMS68_002470 [Peltaster fructicola]
MQSFLQYRRLRRDVERDLSRGRRVARGSAPSVISNGQSEHEKEHDQESVEHENDRVPESYPTSDMPMVPGVTISHLDDEAASIVFVVGWPETDLHNPRDWSMTKKWTTIVTTCILTAVLIIPSSVDGATQEAFNAYFGVNALAGSMTTGIFLIGIGVGSLFSGPFSETFGRNAVYISTMIVVMLFIMGKALAPNYGAAITFRFLAALFAAAPMTVMGGTVGDIWTPNQIAFGLPFATFAGYAGPILGPVIGAYTPQIGFAWADWISMILIGAALVMILLGFPETYGPILLQWRAKHLRDLTGDSRYRAPHAHGSLGSRLLINISRVFTMAWTEPIILIFSFYLTLLYFILFAFLGGYEYIFKIPYGISTSLTYIIFAAMIPGVAVAIALIPFIWQLTKKEAARAREKGQTTPPEVALYWSTVAGGAVLMPVSLFWLGWTCYGSISIWSPIVASGVFGYALVCIFTTSHMYVISVYQDYAASALGFMTFTRYLISGALTPASLQMYESIGPHWSLTLVGVIAALMAPIPYVLHRYGPQIRAMSKNVQNKTGGC